ncbi:MAG: hypothetical protein H7195_08870 [Chryseobacterium sp.]|nr:hypothetical protein [Chryseobacterium sp.]
MYFLNDEKISCSCLFFHLSIFSFSQITSSQIIGNWKVVKILNEIGNQDLANGFESAIFKFDNNFDFTLKSSNDNPLFSKIESMTKNTKWKIDSLKNKIRIGTKKDNYSTIFIEVEQKNERVIFHLIESDIKLEMMKL